MFEKLQKGEKIHNWTCGSLDLAATQFILKRLQEYIHICMYTTHLLMSRQCRVSWASPWSTPPNTNKLLPLTTPRELIAVGAFPVVALTLHTRVSNSTTKAAVTINTLVLELHRYAFFHIFRYRLFAYSCNRYADIYRYSSFLQNRGGGAENHLKFMRINCICNDNVINVINYVGGDFYNVLHSFATISFHGKGSQVVIKQLIKQCFSGTTDPL